MTPARRQPNRGHARSLALPDPRVAHDVEARPPPSAGERPERAGRGGGSPDHPPAEAPARPRAALARQPTGRRDRTGRRRGRRHRRRETRRRRRRQRHARSDADAGARAGSTPAPPRRTSAPGSRPVSSTNRFERQSAATPLGAFEAGRSDTPSHANTPAPVKSCDAVVARVGHGHAPGGVDADALGRREPPVDRRSSEVAVPRVLGHRIRHPVGDVHASRRRRRRCRARRHRPPTRARTPRRT